MIAIAGADNGSDTESAKAAIAMRLRGLFPEG
jgi:hypothetical protein